MNQLLRLSKLIDRLSEWMGRLTLVLMFAMVLVGAYNAIVRYISRFIGTNLSSNLYIELQWYLFTMVFCLGAAYVLSQNRHVRVDILYSRLSLKGKAIVDLVGSTVLLLPICGVYIWFTYPPVVRSWKSLEASPDPNGLPRYPIKTVVIAAFVLLALQGISEIIKNIAILSGVDPRQSGAPLSAERSEEQETEQNNG
ncbi:MAG: TRAP transporter small permease subunit [Synechococcus sp.]